MSDTMLIKLMEFDGATDNPRIIFYVNPAHIVTINQEVMTLVSGREMVLAEGVAEKIIGAMAGKAPHSVVDVRPTPSEFAEAMRKALLEGDPPTCSDDLSRAHRSADDLMCQLLRYLGYGEAVDLFTEAEKGYE